MSSCNSSNLIEKGIFMTKKLYLYNNICYDECPYGSIKNDIDNTCLEINKHISINASLNANIFKEIINSSILNYLSEYANNSVDIKRGYDFSNYFYNQGVNDSFKLELQLPIFDFFVNALKKLKINLIYIIIIFFME